MRRILIWGAVLVLGSSFACIDREEVRDVPASEEALESVPPVEGTPEPGEQEAHEMPRGPDADDPLDIAEVEVILDDFSIRMSERIPATFTRFLIRNKGKTEHSFAVAGQGVVEMLESPLPPGDRTLLEANLEVGLYEAYCPLADHAARGMHHELAVGEPEE